MRRMPVTIISAPRPYAQAILGDLDERRYSAETPDSIEDWAEASGSRAAFVLTDAESDWEIAQYLARLPEVVVVALTVEPSVPQFARALSIGCDGVIHSDTSAEIIHGVLDSAISGEVILPREAAAMMARTIAQAPCRPDMSDDEVLLLRELATGKTIVQLAKDQAWSERTLRRRLHSLYLELGVSNRPQAIAAASRSGLLA